MKFAASVAVTMAIASIFGFVAAWLSIRHGIWSVVASHAQLVAFIFGTALGFWLSWMARDRLPTSDHAPLDDAGGARDNRPASNTLTFIACALGGAGFSFLGVILAGATAWVAACAAATVLCIAIGVPSAVAALDYEIDLGQRRKP